MSSGMIIKCSWLSASLKSEKTQLGTFKYPNAEQGVVQGNKLLYITFTYSNALVEPQRRVLAFRQA